MSFNSLLYGAAWLRAGNTIPLSFAAHMLRLHAQSHASEGLSEAPAQLFSFHSSSIMLCGCWVLDLDL